MTDRLNKTSICSIIFFDIIDYSKKSVSEQIDDKTFFNGLITEAVQNVAPNDRIILDTGDGAAITLMGEPEEALFISLAIRDGILQHNKEVSHPLLVRIGINLGSIRVMKDVNDRPNIIGDGINVAQRIMSFAEPNQIVVSRSYYEVTSRLTKEITSMFTYSGIKQDKHIREHEIYMIKSKGEADSTEQSPRRFYGLNRIKFPNKQVFTNYFVPTAGAALCVALAIMYLKPTPANNDPTVNHVVSTSQTKAESSNIIPASSTAQSEAENKSVTTDADLHAKSSEKSNTETFSKAKVKTSKSHKKSTEKKEVNVTQNSRTDISNNPSSSNSNSNNTHSSNNTSSDTASKIHMPSFKKPVTKHICTQAEIVMNQCEK